MAYIDVPSGPLLIDSGFSQKYLSSFLSDFVSIMPVNPSSFSAPELAQFKNTPALSPPTGVIPNLAAHNDRADLYMILCSIMLSAVYIFVSLRMYSKVWIHRTPGLDDRKAMDSP